MVNWKEIHPNFTEELKAEWEDKGFNYEETKEWIGAGIKIGDADFCLWLKDEKSLTAKKFSKGDNSIQLRKQYDEYLKIKTANNAADLIEQIPNVVEGQIVNPKKPTIVYEALKNVIQNKIKGEIIELNIFSTWFSPACATIVTEESASFPIVRKLRIAIYKGNFDSSNSGEMEINEKMLEFIEIPYIMNTKKTNFLFFSREEGAAIPSISARKKLLKKEADRIKVWLINSEKPAVGLHALLFFWDNDREIFRISFESSKLVVKGKLGEISQLQNPDDYIKPLDVIKRKIGATGLYHFAVYLGDKKVLHVSSYNDLVGKKKEYEGKLNRLIARKPHENDEWLKEKIAELRKQILEEEGNDKKVQITSWDYFLLKHKAAVKEVECYHFLVPFKKPQLIREHIKKALENNFGSGEYKLLTDNCEHFAWLITTSVRLSEQYEVMAVNRLGSVRIAHPKGLIEKINSENEKFKKLESTKVLTLEEEEVLENLQAHIEINSLNYV